MTTVAVIGSTGSIGTQTIEVVAAEPERYEIVALAAGSSVEQLAEQARQVRPRVVGLADARFAPASSRSCCRRAWSSSRVPRRSRTWPPRRT